MANFDKNQWYLLNVASQEGGSFLGSNLYDSGERGTVFFNTTTPTAPRQRWQIFAAGGTRPDLKYVLRTGEGGPTAYLSVNVNTNSANSNNNVGNTLPLMMKDEIIQDEAMYWGIKGWGDGTFFLYNFENGTDWHLEEGGSLAFMSSNVNQARSQQQFSFEPVGATIDDEAYSSIYWDTSSTATNTASSTSVSSPSPTVSSSQQSTLPEATKSSSGKTIGIAVGASLAALIVILLAILFLLRRLKEKRKAQAAAMRAGGAAELDGHQARQEMPIWMNNGKAEKFSPGEVVVPGSPRELPADGYAYGAASPRYRDGADTWRS